MVEESEVNVALQAIEMNLDPKEIKVMLNQQDRRKEKGSDGSRGLSRSKGEQDARGERGLKGDEGFKATLEQRDLLMLMVHEDLSAR